MDDDGSLTSHISTVDTVQGTPSGFSSRAGAEGDQYSEKFTSNMLQPNSEAAGQRTYTPIS